MDLANHLTDRLLFAIPKKGRLHQSCLDLLHGSDIQFHRHSRLDIVLVTNLPIALVFLPSSDIPTFVGEGRVDLAIAGEDVIAEYKASMPSIDIAGVEEVLDLDFGNCKLQVQVPEKWSTTNPADLLGKQIVTSFSNVTKQYFASLEKERDAGLDDKDQNTLPTTNIKYVGGSVEAACTLGVADGIVDLVESGETMRAAGLKPISTVLESSARLIRSKRTSNRDLISKIAARIEGVITAQKYVLCTYNIEENGLEEACQVTPGKRAPTVNSLEEDNWYSISAMVERKKIANIMDKLRKIGGCDILVTKLENCRVS